MEFSFPSYQLSPLYYYLLPSSTFSPTSFFLKTMLIGLKPQKLTFILLNFLVTLCHGKFSFPLPYIIYVLETRVRKKEIKVEVEDLRCLIIRTEAINDSTKPVTDFKRKFRLPGSIDIGRISAKYEDGVLTITVPVPMTFRRGSFYINHADVPDRVEDLVRAA
ncbi:hypothetical protein CXB51_010709 [Gossypium anomalum]|uniref:SHSP domain-containing protein n=1 Tax=Gossypium anomalum TaxID=47600 RepID=A0A8J5Z7N3_9ROSI|nr:hypothetical protein CXB51_010709 [Gossypium anomalum]